MAEDMSSDVLMMLTIGTNPIPADCDVVFSDTALADPNSLLKGFKPGCFFAIESLDVTLTAPAPERKTGTTTKSTTGVQLNEISITRKIDSASLTLMQSCIQAKGYDGAVVVKRRAAGGGEEVGQAYVRFEFDGVLITKIDWSDAHVVKETLTFITRGLQVSYRAQEPSGALGTKVSQAKFTGPVTTK